MSGKLSQQAFEKKAAKEKKELERLIKEQAKPKIPGYMAYFVLIISVVYMADEITTQISTLMQSVVGRQ